MLCKNKRELRGDYDLMLNKECLLALPHRNKLFIILIIISHCMDKSSFAIEKIRVLFDQSYKITIVNNYD